MRGDRDRLNVSGGAMSILIVKPGQIGASRRLCDVLRERHDGIAEANRLDREFRERHGMPMTEMVDWQEEKEKHLSLLTQAIDSKDAIQAQACFVAGMARFSSVPADPGEWTVPRGTDEIWIRPRSLSAGEVSALRQLCADAYNAKDGIGANDAEGAWVARALAEVSGLAFIDELGSEKALRIWSQGPAGMLTGDEVAMIRESGMFPWLFTAVAWMATLPPGKALRSGVLPPKT
jgi:hypothetical protein